MELIQSYEGFDLGSDYFITEEGNVFSKKQGKLKQLKGEKLNGYLRVKLYSLNFSKKILVHRLVGVEFIPNPENKPFINHKNGVKWDNRVENLEWCTYSENLLHAYSVLKRKFPNSKLEINDILIIRKNYSKGKSVNELKSLFNVSHSTISEIFNNKRYKNI